MDCFASPFELPKRCFDITNPRSSRRHPLAFPAIPMRRLATAAPRQQRRQHSHHFSQPQQRPYHARYSASSCKAQNEAILSDQSTPALRVADLPRCRTVRVATWYGVVCSILLLSSLVKISLLPAHLNRMPFKGGRQGREDRPSASVGDPETRRASHERKGKGGLQSGVVRSWCRQSACTIDAYQRAERRSGAADGAVAGSNTSPVPQNGPVPASEPDTAW